MNTYFRFYLLYYQSIYLCFIQANLIVIYCNQFPQHSVGYCLVKTIKNKMNQSVIPVWTWPTWGLSSLPSQMASGLLLGLPCEFCNWIRLFSPLIWTIKKRATHHILYLICISLQLFHITIRVCSTMVSPSYQHEALPGCMTGRRRTNVPMPLPLARSTILIFMTTNQSASNFTRSEVWIIPMTPPHLDQVFMKIPCLD